MSVVSYGREPGYPQTSQSLEGQPPSRKVVTRHTDRLKIIVNSEADVGEVLLNQLPYQIGDAFDVSGFDPPLLSKLNLTRDKTSRLQWYLDLAYEPLADEDKDKKDNDKSPDQREPEWYWDFETIEHAFAFDVDEKFIATSAGEVIELTRPIAIPVLHIEKYELEFDPNTITDYVNHRNSEEFWGVSPGDALMAGITDRKDTNMSWGGNYYRKVSFVIKFMLPFITDVQEGWTDLIPDAGTYYLDLDGNKIPFKAKGSETTGLLNGVGNALANVQSPPFTPYKLKFNRFPEADFNDLDLGPF